MTLIDYCIIIFLAACIVGFWIKIHKDLKDVKRRVKSLEDAQRESHEPGYWAKTAGK